MNSLFLVELCSDLDYEEMVADVSYGNQILAIIDQEKGIDQMEIEIFMPDSNAKSWKLPLDEFIKTLHFAKKTLEEMQKFPDE